MEGILSLTIQLVSGAVSGNVAGSLLKNLSLGTIGNSVIGILGGGISGQVLGIIDVTTSSGITDIDSYANGGIGGAVLVVIIGLIKKAFSNKVSS